MVEILLSIHCRLTLMLIHYAQEFFFCPLFFLKKNFPLKALMEVVQQKNLGNENIERQRIKIKHMENMGGIFKIVAGCSTQSSLVTNYKNWVPPIFEISTKINFASKLHFPFILVIGLRLKRENHRISIVKRVKYHQYRLWPPKQPKFVSNSFVL